MDKMKFSYKAYRELIEKICFSGYDVCSYHNYSSSNNPCILRHDVDFDLKKAVKMAVLERELGVKSTYFVLVNTSFYSVLATESRKCMEKILNLGHDIGLHFDEMQYDIDGDYEVLVRKIHEESEVLEKLLCVPVTTVSMHRPSKGLLDANVKVPRMVNSYSSLFFQKFKYFSDSRMYWREDVLSGIEVEKNPALHILTHPFWYSDKEESMQQILERFIRGAQIERYDCLDKNFRDLNTVITRSEIMER